MMESLDRDSLRCKADELAERDPLLADALRIGGQPKLWKRPATFATFIRIILEQQVSLASAWNTYERLRPTCPGGRVTPAAVAAIGQDGLKGLGFSRQKARYAEHLAQDCLAGRFKIRPLARLPDDEVRERIVARLGLGDWSADIYLMLALTRPDLLPIGDLAIVKGFGMLAERPDVTGDEILDHAHRWRPYRSVAARMIWGVYLQRKNTTLPPGAFES